MSQHKAPLAFTHDQLPGRIVFGLGSRRRVAGEVMSLSPTSVLIISGRHDAATVSDLENALDVPSQSIVGVRPHVPAESVEQALDIVDQLRPNVVVTIGGGSATGLGKMMAKQRDTTLVAVPTTYAGSEMTPIWGTTTNGVKQTGRSSRVLPSVVIYDPELTVGLPMAATVNSAFNALAHCIEALWLDDTSPISAETAVNAIGSIIDGVGGVAASLDDVDARAQLLYGAHRAGTVLAHAGTGLLHKTAHVLGGMFDLDHGAMYAVLTPHMITYHLAKTSEARHGLETALGSDPAAALGELAAHLGAPRSLADIGFPADELPEAAASVAAHAGVNVAEIEQLLTTALLPAPAKERQ